MSNKIQAESLFQKIEKEIIANGLTIIGKDHDRPWGGFFIIDEQQAKQFINMYFNGTTQANFKHFGKLSPKILLIEPNKRLSWQYHHRRSEIWKVIEGPVGVIKSNTDKQRPLKEYVSGDVIELQQGERHRLVGLNNWGIVAEIWQHTDEANPSDEDDIVRIQDDFGR